MGIYTEYIDRGLDFEGLAAERNKQLKRISTLRGGRDILVYAADLNKSDPRVGVVYADLLPIRDVLSGLAGKALDVILETPGGSGQVAEDIVRLLHEKYDDVAFIVPGYAKSAGTILAMAGDEILMGPGSALGPIDAQLTWQGKTFSADALLEGVERIKDEVAQSGILNKAYIPILQGISPGELQSAENALKFAQVLVRDWLIRYKFKDWTVHSSTGQPVTPDEKRARAEEIATALCDHRRWLTHGRSVKIEDLDEMRLRITDFSKATDLNDAISRYQILLTMTFESNLYKVFETVNATIYRGLAPAVPPPQMLQALQQAQQMAGLTDHVVVEARCGRCGTGWRVQANLKKGVAQEQGAHLFPPNNRSACPKCSAPFDLTEARRQIEAQTKKRVVT